MDKWTANDTCATVSKLSHLNLMCADHGAEMPSPHRPAACPAALVGGMYGAYRVLGVLVWILVLLPIFSLFTCLLYLIHYSTLFSFTTVNLQPIWPSFIRHSTTTGRGKHLETGHEESTISTHWGSEARPWYVDYGEMHNTIVCIWQQLFVYVPFSCDTHRFILLQDAALHGWVVALVAVEARVLVVPSNCRCRTGRWSTLQYLRNLTQYVCFCRMLRRPH